MGKILRNSFFEAEIKPDLMELVIGRLADGVSDNQNHKIINC